MWSEYIKPVLGQILSSKKALALIAGFIVWVLAQAGVASSPDQVLPILGFIASYILGQGLADHKKSEAQVLVAAMGKPQAPVAKKARAKK